MQLYSAHGSKIGLVLLLTFLLPNILSGQVNQNKQKARDILSKAIDTMDQGDVKSAITMLNEACSLDPETPEYLFELGYAYYLNKDYSKAIEILNRTLSMKDVTDQYYQMLGNIYDETGQSDSAIRIYNQGLEKFPNSGRLFLESGNMKKNAPGEALRFYEEGINADPEFPSNYYNAAKIYCSSSERLWGVLYGEIFMLLEPGTKRTEKMSKLLFDTYSKAILFESDTSIVISFCKNETVIPGSNRLPYVSGLIEPVMAFSTFGENKITLESLSRIRTNFIKNYFQNESANQYKNILFEWHKTLIEEGVFEAYNHWLFMKGAEDEFLEWKKNNSEKFSSFINWMKSNYLQIDNNHKLYSKNF
ncbi:MAG: tetratricopeptide repeat protein [archaeon]